MDSRGDGWEKCTSMASSSLSKRFGAAIRRRRLEAALTQEQLAESARIHPTYVSMVERGVKNPTLDVADRLARALSVPLQEIIRDVQKP
jgi:transcriptional regulator with XRE-family HTH domain